MGRVTTYNCRRNADGSSEYQVTSGRFNLQKHNLDASITTTLNTYGHLMPSAFQGGWGTAGRPAARHQEGTNRRRQREGGSRPKARTRALKGFQMVGEEGFEPPTSSV